MSPRRSARLRSPKRRVFSGGAYRIRVPTTKQELTDKLTMESDIPGHYLFEATRGKVNREIEETERHCATEIASLKQRKKKLDEGAYKHAHPPGSKRRAFVKGFSKLLGI